MGNTLYLECYSGISGDMMVAALLDLGADEKILQQALLSLNVDGFQTIISRVKKSGIDACDFRVQLEAKYENHDHDMEFLHGDHFHENEDHEGIHKHHEHEHHGHEHYEHEHHKHEHHGHEHHRHEHNKHKNHSHEHRNLSDILNIIEKADISRKAKETAIRIFEIIGEAEAKAHGTTLDQVHFHEVGAVDSIVDIVSVAVCLDNLNIEQVIVPVLYEGKGFVRCQHGMMPIPVPAVSNIAASHQLTLHVTNTEGELITPTGAAIVAAIKTSNLLPKDFTILKIGIGAGKRTYERPSMLRAMLIQENLKESTAIIKLESNIDDCSGETLGFVMEQLFEAGALDVFYIPIYMKKNRPAYQLTVICMEEDVNTMEQIIFHETTTIGIRKIRMERTILKREIVNMDTSLGKVQVKVCELNSGKRYYPEYSCVTRLCKEKKLPYQEVYQRIQSEIKNESR